MSIDPIDYEIVGVGFGPANLALGVALHDTSSRLRHAFYEEKPDFAWHPGMQFEGSNMQTPFLEDLATRHDPRSEFTFLNYLKAHGRLTDFADLRDFYPTRTEFNDYFRWAAHKLAHCVRYDTYVSSIAPVVGNDDEVHALDVTVQDARAGREFIARTRNVVIGIGLTPVAPKALGSTMSDGRVFHSITTIPSLHSRFASREAPYSFLVAGAGQSAAEITVHLLRQYRNARVTVVSRGFVFRAKDSNAFISAFYTGNAADQFFDLDEDSRNLLLTTLDTSNYSAADTDVLRDLAKLVYQDKVEGRRRLELRSFCELQEVEETESMVRVQCWDQLHKRTESLDVDGLCLATGFSDAALKYALADVHEYLKCTDVGDYCVNREYRLESEPGFHPGVYVQGYARNSHGCTEGTISDLPHRANRIIDSIHHRRYEHSEIRPVVAEGIA